ncbi:rap1 GTPase-GDP dissociation stimulator 1 [Megalops cyprinoides]|uniref:rap1 GTPase-GDP dissociation stimulator 1 n=1 Tax=Megalops cyprinoides TaxID=118141 RepID=UPI001864701C|nr:rap1 GTPase-GDP dissociation stimulator 1 [Megalops cyprinoides]
MESPAVTAMESFSEALDAISVSTELIEEELRPHLDTVLAVLQETKRGVAQQVADSGILPTLAQILERRSALNMQTTLLVAELARDASVRERCMEAGLGFALMSLLSSTDQDLLLYTGRAISRICYDNNLLQDQLVQSGIIPHLVAIIEKYPANAPLVSVCLLALCNLADMGEEDSSAVAWERVGPCGEGEKVYRGTRKHSFGLSSTATMVRLQRWSDGQHSVTVEVLHRCSRALWVTHVGLRAARRFPPAPLSVCPKFYRAVKYGVRNLPKAKSLKSTVFHTFL